MQPPDGPPVLNGLEFLVSGNTAANLKDNVSQRDAHGDFHKTGIVHLPDKGEDLGAFAAFRA